jgi:hypothetical protein
MTSRRSAIVCLLTAFDAACSSTSESSGPLPGDAGSMDGALGPNSPGVVVAHEMNALIKENYETRCRLCPPCGPFQEVGPQGDVCGGLALDAFPDLKVSYFCKIEAARHYGDCLRAAADCAAVSPCDAMKTEDEAQCPVFSGDAGNFMLPKTCTQ